MKSVTISVNKPEETLSVAYGNFFGPSSLTHKSPIDKFHDVCSELARLTSPVVLGSNSAMPRLLILGFVSSVEEYLRSIFTQLIHICPVARSQASQHSIRFGAIDYYKPDSIAAALFDQSSFSSKEEIQKKLRNLLGIEVNSSLNAALSELDKVFHVRHCAVHGGGVLNGHNADQLRLDKTFVGQELLPGTVELQDTLKICLSFVRAFNQHVLSETIKRWRGAKLTSQWKVDKDDFVKLIDLFWSEKDMNMPPDVRTIYGQVVKVPVAAEIYAFDDKNHAIIDSVIKKCIRGDDVQRTAIHLEVLDKDERSTAISFMYKYDDLFCKDVLITVVSSTSNPLVCLECIDFITANFEIDQDFVFKLEEFTQDTDDNVKFKAIDILIVRYGRKLDELYPALLNFNDETLLSVLEKLNVLHEIRVIDEKSTLLEVITNKLPNDVRAKRAELVEEQSAVHENRITVTADYDVTVAETSGIDPEVDSFSVTLDLSLLPTGEWEVIPVHNK